MPDFLLLNGPNYWGKVNRHGKRATIITSQLPIKKWYEVIGETTIADAILDRVLNNAQRIELKGDSLRRKTEKKDDNETK